MFPCGSGIDYSALKTEKMKKRILCDYKCPLHESCRFYVEGFVKSKTDHWGVNPYNYNKGTCQGFEQLTEDDLIDRINSILKPLNN